MVQDPEMLSMLGHLYHFPVQKALSVLVLKQSHVMLQESGALKHPYVKVKLQEVLVNFVNKFLFCSFFL